MNSVSLIGTGNVAWNLAHAFHHAGIPINKIWSRTADHAVQLCQETSGMAVSHIHDLQEDPGLIMICVPDHAIAEVVQLCQTSGLKNPLICHTSGATPLDVFPAEWTMTGVFYPLQTLTKGHHRDFQDIPILLSSRSDEMNDKLSRLARQLSEKTTVVTDEARQRYHLAAVMVNNFVYHLCDQAFTQVETHRLDPRVLFPLLKETVEKLIHLRGDRVQTGPAIRGDVNSIHAHLRLLAGEPALAALYRQLSLSINPGLDL
ncbi:MAG: DUF2520 domain-containing protein [Saprospiraceae bacterium]|nr:DUF2520 domain-containing protein [Saprospiraceae bacterium]